MHTGAGAQAPQDIPALHERAVQDARAGRLQEAVDALRALAGRSSDPRITFDLVVVLGWMARHAEAVGAWQALGAPDTLPNYVRQALIGSLLQSGDATQAQEQAERWLQQAPEHPGALLAAAEVAQRQGQRMQALRLAGEAGLQGADADRVQGLQAQLLGELGGHEGAWRLSAAPTLAQRADRAALRLRLARRLNPDAPGQRLARLEAVTAELDAMAAELAAGGDFGRVWQQVLGDRAVAHVEGRHWQAALDDVQALRERGVALPSHVRLAEGGALLGLQRPAQARQAYEAVLQQEPQDLQAQTGLLLALSDLQDWTAALALADAISPQRVQAAGRSPQSPPDADWLDARIRAARVRNWSGDAASAWAALNRLAAEAANHTGLRAALAEVAAARGWPRRAQEELEMARALSEDDEDVQIGLADSALRLQQWDRLREQLDWLQQAEVDPATLARLRREQALARGAELDAELALRSEPGTGGRAAAHSQRLAVRGYSPLWQDRWRGFAETGQSWFRPPSEVAVDLRRSGAGSVWQDGGSRLELGLWQHAGAQSRSGASLDVAQTLDDHWRLWAGASTLSGEVPLRGVAVGTHANSRSAGVEYARDERLSSSLQWQALALSDGNQRESWQWRARQQLHGQPLWRLWAEPQLYASSNRRSDVPYFSPARDGFAALSLVSERVIRGQAQLRWSERVAFTLGRYQQQGYGSSATQEIAYEQTLELRQALELTAGLGQLRRPYDGNPARATLGQLRLKLRF